MIQSATLERRPRRAAQRLGVALVVGLAACAAGCETDPGAGGFVPSCITFAPEREPTDGEVTIVWGQDSTCDTIELEVVAAGLDDVWSASFELVFPEELMLFAAESFGDSLLREDGNSLLVNTEVQQEDIDVPPDGIEETLLVVGISRTDSDANVGVSSADAPDSSLIVRLIFFRFATGGSAPITFRNAVLERVDTPGQLPSAFDPPVVFTGGEVAIEN